MSSSVTVSLEDLQRAPHYHHILRLAILGNALQNVSYLLCLVDSDYRSNRLKSQQESARLYLMIQLRLYLAAGVEVLPQLFSEMRKGRSLERLLSEDIELKACVDRLRDYLPESERYATSKGTKYDSYQNCVKTVRDTFGAHVVSEPGGKVLKKALRILIESLRAKGRPCEGAVEVSETTVVSLFADDVLATGWQVHGLKLSNARDDDEALRLLRMSNKFVAELQQDFEQLCSSLVPAYLMAFDCLSLH